MGSFCQVLSYDVIRCTFESLDSRVKNVFPLHRWKATWRKMVQKCRCGLEGPTCGQKWDFANSVRTPHFNKWGQNSHGARTECWQLTFLETTYTFTFVSVIHNIEHFNMTRDITFTLYIKTWLSYQEVEGLVVEIQAGWLPSQWQLSKTASQCLQVSHHWILFSCYHEFHSWLYFSEAFSGVL